MEMVPSSSATNRLCVSFTHAIAVAPQRRVVCEMQKYLVDAS